MYNLGSWLFSFNILFLRFAQVDICRSFHCYRIDHHRKIIVDFYHSQGFRKMMQFIGGDLELSVDLYFRKAMAKLGSLVKGFSS